MQVPLSGGLAPAGVDIQRAAELALEQLSRPLEELGFRVELAAFDDQANPDIGVANARQITDDQAFLCGVGHFNSAVTIAASEIYHTAGIAFITPTSTNPQVTDRGYLEMNRVVGRDDVQGKVGAQFAQVRGFRRIIIIHDGSGYGLGLAEIFREEAERIGLQVVEMLPNRDSEAIIAAIAQARPDVIYFGGTFDQAGPLFGQIRESGYLGALLGGDGLDSPDLLKLGGPALVEGSGMFYTSILVNPATYPQAAGFVQDFEEKFGSYPQPFAAPAYDALGICLEAIETAARAKNGDLPTRREVAEAIRALRDYPGLTNTFTFDERGDPLMSKYMVVKVAFPDPERWSENEIFQVLEIASPRP